ncbi:TIGR04452 family lipoprotein [Leptospira fluminis]|uniref:TIGR04452 family lipoprotein n=3 Tax=Leptospiraceae TaxID=170 RepID=A0A4R9GS25_9LEPT|nr:MULTISPECIES: TIGR04452 family lipoprotein [Leptospira]TGK14165.1 TIGR04452 family lipoprotein [Leptospira fletcheri]TGK19427.1 TIGR04452 family lipoprotein [Leptospira fluminis]
MRKKAFFLSNLFCVLLVNCAVLDPIGFTYDRVKGDVASNEIQNAAITTDLVNSAILSGKATVSILSVIAGDVAGIDPTKYYKKSVVDQCVSDIKGFKGYLIGSTLTIVTSCQKIEADGLIY